MEGEGSLWGWPGSTCDLQREPRGPGCTSPGGSGGERSVELPSLRTAEQREPVSPLGNRNHGPEDQDSASQAWEDGDAVEQRLGPVMWGVVGCRSKRDCLLVKRPWGVPWRTHACFCMLGELENPGAHSRAGGLAKASMSALVAGYYRSLRRCWNMDEALRMARSSIFAPCVAICHWKVTYCEAHSQVKNIPAFLAALRHM